MSTSLNFLPSRDHLSGLSCSCGMPLSHRDEIHVYASTKNSYVCPACNTLWDRRGSHNIEDLAVTVITSCELFVDESNGIDNTMSAVWYHASEHNAWLEDAKVNAHPIHTANNDPEDVPMVHVGTYSAACERAKSLRARSAAQGKNRPVYMHFLVLDPGAIINEVIFPDDDQSFPVSVLDCDGDYLVGANRYVNRYESAGSVSLLVDPLQLITVKSEVIS